MPTVRQTVTALAKQHSDAGVFVMNTYRRWSNYYDRKQSNPQAVFLEFYDESSECRASIGEDKFRITYGEVREGKTRAFEKWLRRDLECCVCYEGSSPFLPCCDVSLCLRCYVKMVCLGEYKCPCCRTEKVLQMSTAIYAVEKHFAELENRMFRSEQVERHQTDVVKHWKKIKRAFERFLDDGTKLVSKAEMMRFVDMQRDFAEMLWNLDDDEQIVFATFSSSSED